MEGSALHVGNKLLGSVEQVQRSESSLDAPLAQAAEVPKANVILHAVATILARTPEIAPNGVVLPGVGAAGPMGYER